MVVRELAKLYTGVRFPSAAKMKVYHEDAHNLNSAASDHWTITTDEVVNFVGLKGKEFSINYYGGDPDAVPIGAAPSSGVTMKDDDRTGVFFIGVKFTGERLGKLIVGKEIHKLVKAIFQARKVVVNE